MSIQSFYAQLESGTEKSPLFVALRRLSQLGEIKNLICAATSPEAGGWVYWNEVPGTAECAVAARA
jgi:hypothetical protein